MSLHGGIQANIHEDQRAPSWFLEQLQELRCCETATLTCQLGQRAPVSFSCFVGDCRKKSYESIKRADVGDRVDGGARLSPPTWLQRLTEDEWTESKDVHTHARLERAPRTQSDQHPRDGSVTRSPGARGRRTAPPGLGLNPEVCPKRCSAPPPRPRHSWAKALGPTR